MYEFIRNSGLFTRFPVTLETSKFKEGFRSENVIYFIGKTFVLNFFYENYPAVLLVTLFRLLSQNFEKHLAASSHLSCLRGTTPLPLDGFS